MVEAPFGAWPGEVQGCYASDREGVIESFAATRMDAVDKYVDKYVDSFADDREMLDKLVGARKLIDLRRRAVIKEGYHA